MVINSPLNLSSSKLLKVKLVKSSWGRLPKHKATLEALGLRRIGQTVVKPNNPSTLGMIKKVDYLLAIETE